MHNSVSFSFRNAIYHCRVFIDSTMEPYYVFIDLLDKELIEMFGPEVTIKTDFEQRLPKRDDYPALVELRQAIFNAITAIPEFISAKLSKSNHSPGYL